jgi:hypothetical protein
VNLTHFPTFLGAVISSWLFWIGACLTIEPFAEVLAPPKILASMKRLLGERRDGRRTWLRWLGLAVLLVAVFQAWDVEYSARLNVDLLGGQRHLTEEQKTRLAAALKLPDNQTAYVDVNSATSCADCEEYAQELRDFIGSIPGWRADGGPAFDTNANLRGLKIYTRVDTPKPEIATLLGKALDSASMHFEWEANPGGPADETMLMVGWPPKQ